MSIANSVQQFCTAFCDCAADMDGRKAGQVKSNTVGGTSTPPLHKVLQNSQNVRPLVGDRSLRKFHV